MASTVEAALPASVTARVGHLYELAPADCARWFGHGRYARYGVTGDGSCFFHSVCALLDVDGYMGKPHAEQARIAHKFRCDFQAKLNEREFNYLASGGTPNTRKTFQQTRDALCDPRVWADEVMIKHAAAVLGMNIVFLDLRRDAMYCGVHGKETLQVTSPRRRAGVSAGAGAGAGAKSVPRQATVVVAWVDGSHFEPVFQIERVTPEGGAQIRGLFQPSKSKADAALVRHLMGAYTAQCSPRVHDAHVL